MAWTALCLLWLPFPFMIDFCIVMKSMTVVCVFQEIINHYSNHVLLNMLCLGLWFQERLIIWTNVTLCGTFYWTLSHPHPASVSLSFLIMIMGLEYGDKSTLGLWREKQGSGKKHENASGDDVFLKGKLCFLCNFTSCHLLHYGEDTDSLGPCYFTGRPQSPRRNEWLMNLFRIEPRLCMQARS